MTWAMLAVPGTPDRIADLEADGGWVFQPKVDGVRVRVGDGKVLLRSGREARVPELDEVVEFLGDTVVDGELYIPGGTSTDVSALTSATGARLRRGDLMLEAFDILADGPRDLRLLPLTHRWAVLHEALRDAPDEVGVIHSTARGIDLWTVVVDAGSLQGHVEGVMAKSVQSAYIPGRSPAWVKVKMTRTLTVVVTGWDIGEGRREATVGALHVGLIDDDGDLVPVGKVGSGFTVSDLEMLRDLLSAETLFCVEVRHMGFTPHGRLRHPVFLRVRDDVGVLAASTSQLEA